MAIPVLRPFGIISYNKIRDFLHPISSPRLNSINNPKKLVYCAPSSVSNLVGSEAGVSLNVGTHLIPHPDKVEKGGEDAFLVSSHGGGVIAVADGVSGWAQENVNPALFSRELMANASSLVEDEEVNYDPRSLIRKAHAATTSIGSATAVVAMLERNGILKIANVGDCGVRVIRKGQIVFSTSPQEHYFDCPYQLSSEAVGQTFLDATVTTVELVEEDTVVMGSDGLFDNVFDREIVSAVSSCDNVSDAAKALANLAHNHSKDSSFDSPYSQEARAKGFDVPWWKKIMGMKLTGGKLDDITVIVGQVKSSLSS
ncbi:Serine/threonine protein phosphatase [Handroanthus impetiginosus]|uniref:Protein phosphatase n=1 Tax=Handroanthus impetiginosus TaxID=429701 RepID=A0A2G9FX92_9LAMI|nr:Serine/threonine protein phosphatase [Handroanthus impetiginosus]